MSQKLSVWIKKGSEYTKYINYCTEGVPRKQKGFFWCRWMQTAIWQNKRIKATVQIVSSNPVDRGIITHNFVTSSLSVHQAPFEKGSSLKGKSLLPTEKIHFFLRWSQLTDYGILVSPANLSIPNKLKIEPHGEKPVIWVLWLMKIQISCVFVQITEELSVFAVSVDYVRAQGSLMQTAKILIGLHKYTGWSEASLIANFMKKKGILLVQLNLSTSHPENLIVLSVTCAL